MIERPILFNAEMVRAILDDRKTQTRRAVPEKLLESYYEYDEWCDCVMPNDIPCTREYEKEFFLKRCKYGQPGDRLWVRETFTILGASAGWECQSEDGLDFEEGCATVLYQDKMIRKIDDLAINDNGVDEGEQAVRLSKKKATSPIYMPRWASRITLEITDIRVERIQDISEEDCIKEGFSAGNTNIGLRYVFGSLWNSIYAKHGLGWDANPWVYVIDFKRLKEVKND